MSDTTTSDRREMSLLRRAGEISVGDCVEDSSGERRTVAEVEHFGDEIVLHDAGGDVLILTTDQHVGVIA